MSESKICPTCEEKEPFSGTCGTSKDDTKALCRRTAPAEPAMSLDKYMDMMYDRDSHAKEVERLNNALEAEKRSVENEVKRRNQYAKESDELDRQVQALKADAERYRWLRRKNRNNIVVRNGVSHLFDELLDRSIDAARTAKPEVDHE